MCSPEFKQAMSVPQGTPTPMYEQGMSHGYPVVSPNQAGLGNYMAGNPHVAGMAWGGGSNGSDPSSPRQIVVNPHNPMMFLPENREGLMKIEAIRHKMDESNYQPAFDITPEMQKYREGAYQSTDPYLNNDARFKQSLVSRAAVGDLPAGTQSAGLQAAANQFQSQYFPQNRLSP